MAYKICIDRPFINCEKIYPIQQQKVRELLDCIDYENVSSVIIFGSSVNNKCHVDSDLDVYMELKTEKYPIVSALHFAYDLWTNYSVDEHLLKEIHKEGVFVYGR